LGETRYRSDLIKYNTPDAKISYITSKDIAIHNRERKINISESNPWEDKVNNYVPPNRITGHPKLVTRFTP
jgi:hypothetical protein